MQAEQQLKAERIEAEIAQREQRLDEIRRTVPPALRKPQCRLRGCEARPLRSVVDRYAPYWQCAQYTRSKHEKQHKRCIYVCFIY